MSDIAATVEGQNQTPVDVTADSVSSFSFDSLHDKAMAYGQENTPAANAATEQVASDPATPVVEEPTNVDNASAAQLAQLDDNQLVEVTVDGQPVQLPWKEAKAGIMRQQHYTRNMQAFRQEQQQFEQNRAAAAKAQEEREVLVGLLNNKDLMKQFLERQYPDLLAQAQAVAEAQQAVDPNDIATVGQLQQLQEAAQANINGMMQNFRAEVERQVTQVTQTIEDRAAVAKLSESINGTIQDIFKAHPFIEKVYPNAEQLLRYEVMRLAPTTPEQTIAAFKQVAEGWAETFNSEVTARNKTSVINKQKLTTNNIQPPGGAAPQPTPTNFKTVNPHTGKVELDWNKMREAALNYGK